MTDFYLHQLSSWARFASLHIRSWQERRNERARRDGGELESSLRINLLLLMARRMRNMFSHYFNFFIRNLLWKRTHTSRAKLGRIVCLSKVAERNFILNSDTKKRRKFLSLGNEDDARQTRVVFGRERKKKRKELRKNENLIRLIYYWKLQDISGTRSEEETSERRQNRSECKH